MNTKIALSAALAALILAGCAKKEEAVQATEDAAAAAAAAADEAANAAAEAVDAAGQATDAAVDATLLPMLPLPLARSLRTPPRRPVRPSRRPARPSSRLARPCRKSPSNWRSALAERDGRVPQGTRPFHFGFPPVAAPAAREFREEVGEP
jgi:hypothetical protein